MYKINFTTGETIDVPQDKNLSEVVDITSSPILFGCRTGICATCIVKVHTGSENLSLMDEDEKEVIEINTNESDCRLACCLKLKGDVTLEYLGK